MCIRDSSMVVDIQRKALGIKSGIIPMSDEKSDMVSVTDNGEMEFHEFLVTKQGIPNVVDIKYNIVAPTPGLVECVEESDMIVLGPSNPITSIWPIVSIAVSYTHLRAHETVLDLVCRLLLEKKKKHKKNKN